MFSIRLLFNSAFLILLLAMYSCNNEIRKYKELTLAFEKLMDNCDLVMYDQDPLHPRYGYLKGGKIIGLKINNNPECGQITEHYIFDDKENMKQIIVRQDFLSGHCEKTDSLFIINTESKESFVYVNDEKFAINNIKYLEYKFHIDIPSLKNEMKQWIVK